MMPENMDVSDEYDIDDEQTKLIIMAIEYIKGLIILFTNISDSCYQIFVRDILITLIYKSFRSSQPNLFCR